MKRRATFAACCCVEEEVRRGRVKGLAERRVMSCSGDSFGGGGGGDWFGGCEHLELDVKRRWWRGVVVVQRMGSRKRESGCEYGGECSCSCSCIRLAALGTGAPSSARETHESGRETWLLLDSSLGLSVVMARIEVAVVVLVLVPVLDLCAAEVTGVMTLRHVRADVDIDEILWGSRDSIWRVRCCWIFCAVLRRIVRYGDVLYHP